MSLPWTNGGLHAVQQTITPWSSVSQTASNTDLSLTSLPKVVSKVCGKGVTALRVMACSSVTEGEVSSSLRRDIAEMNAS